MAKYLNRAQLKKASDEEIEQFFSETYFEGIFSHEIRSSNVAFFKGCITDIQLEGKLTNIAPSFINVPISSNYVPEGPCTFKCKLNIDAFRGKPSKYIIRLVGRSLKSIDSLSSPLLEVSAANTKNEDLYEMWGVNDCQCIGYYHYDDKSQKYVVDDLRKPNFDHIPYYPGDKEKQPIRITYPHEIKGIKLNDYYIFTWKLSHKNRYNPYEIYLDFSTQPRTINPKWFIDTLFDDRHNDKSKNFGSAAGFLDTLSKQLSAKESTFVYELLQNANDYPVEGKTVDVEFHVTENYLLFLHSGEKFNVRNISGICGINEKEKTANKKTIGYKGIGFKTVFLNNHYVYLRTGKYSFRFDEGEMPEKKMGGKIRRLGAPFQILPIWTTHGEVAQEVNEVFDSADKKFQVLLALRPEDKKILHVGKNSYENLFKDIFADANIILFIPNINSVKVIIDGEVERECFRNSQEWVVGEYEEDIRPELQESINKTIDKGNSRIPEKYKDFDRTKISFACKHEGAIIKPVEKATLYCYLPTGASWGFPFLMNTDMVPKGDRNDIETEVKLINAEESNFNEEIAYIAGLKLFLWIKDLLTSKRFQLGSVFSLIPDFKKCMKEHEFYDVFIEKFEDAFDSCIEKETIVPVQRGIANVKHIILDSTGLSVSGIMTDEEFRKFTGMEDYYLPLAVLRKDKNFNSFLRRYTDDDQKFTVDNLTDLIANEDFQEWLKIQGNNDKFLNFLLEKDYLKDLLDEEIFLEDEGSLFKAEDLFYDVDEYLVDLQAFTNHICFLSTKTREFFKDNEKWENAIDGAFAEFDCDDFVNNELLSSDNKADTIEKLKDKETSLHFFKFLAENVEYQNDYMSLPFIDDKNNVVDEFDGRFLFFTSERGHNICSSSWLSNICFDFVSDEYLPIVKDYFKDYFGVRNYSDDIIVNDIILSDDYADDVSEAINDDFDISYDFVNFCFANEKIIEDGGLSKYSLKVFDCAGEEDWFIADGDVFFSSSDFDFYTQKQWLGSDWMASLDEAYYKDATSKNELKTFIHRAFGVEELADKNFYENIVKSHLKDIFVNISGDNDGDGTKNIDFIKYLDDNLLLIFTEHKDSDVFVNLKLVTYDICDVDANAEYLYIYDEELKEIIENDWFPEDVVILCHPDYGKSKALAAIGVKSYKFGEFYDDVIVENLESINDNITTKENSVAFHNFIIEHLSSLTPDQQTKMLDAKVYLYGQEEAVDNAGGHKTLSAKAKELFDKGLVEFSDLDLIDPDYKTENNVEYWETRLGNTKFTVNHFFSWLKDNIETFCDTLQDEDLNLTFWRWLKNNVSEKLIEEANSLPVLLKDGTLTVDGPIFFSDDYIDGAGIEKSIKFYDKKAKFLSYKYIEDGDDIKNWREFFSKAGIKYEIVDILIDTVIPHLSEIEDEGLPKLLVENLDALKKNYGNKLISQLTDLRVKSCNGGVFYAIGETVYVDCQKAEPFPYIVLPNQIVFQTAKECQLIEDIIDEAGGVHISKLGDWQQNKINHYLDMQDNDVESIRPFHYKLINDLSLLRNKEREVFTELKCVDKIMLLNRDDEFRDASTLTMGSIFRPFFDFESCGIDSLEYVSDLYSTTCSEYVGKLFRELNVHCDFEEDDIEFLVNRQCSIYFWGTYLKKKDADIPYVKQLIEEKKLNDIACIPTKDYMKCPSDLYYGEELERYVKMIEDWENKVPLSELPDIKLSDESTLFDGLPFKKTLDFLDALYALININDQERRPRLLDWMIDSYDESYDSKIQEYREDEQALWYNNRNEKIQIKNLYALHNKDKTLLQFFGSNPRIINNKYFPSGDSFLDACDILNIKIITSEELRMEPVDDVEFTARENIHRLYALVIAGMIDNEEWQDLYKNFCERLDMLTLHRCSSILLTYVEDSDIYQSLKKFYHKAGSNDFYFVKSLDDKLVYESYVWEFMDFIGVDKDDITYDQVKIIMDSQESALETAKGQNDLMLDDDFKDELDKLIPGIKQELSGNEADADEDDTSYKRPSFITSDYEEENEDDGGGMTSVEIIEDIDDAPDDETPDDGNGEEIPDEIPDPASGGQPKGSGHRPSHTPHERRPRLPYTPRPSSGKRHKYSDMSGWNDSGRENTPLEPKPFSPEDVRKFGSHGVTRTLEVLEPTTSEISEINRILGEDLTAEEVADHNYLAQLRLYNNLVQKGYRPEESIEDFVRNAHLKNIHTLSGGKYIHKCSAAGGIMYLSPSIWNKIADDRCVVCVYLGPKANEFMYFHSLDEILEWIGEDDIVIKLTGDEKVDVVQELYSGVLYGKKGTAYTLIRINSNEKYNSVFAPLADKEINQDEENPEDYDE